MYLFNSKQYLRYFLHITINCFLVAMTFIKVMANQINDLNNIIMKIHTISTDDGKTLH